MRNETEIRQICDRVRKTAFELHSWLRHGHLEKVHENGLANRLRREGLKVELQKPLQVVDEDGSNLGEYYADLFVEDCLIIELKACRALAVEHVAQVPGYLRASNQRHAQLINFGSPRFEIRKLIL